MKLKKIKLWRRWHEHSKVDAEMRRRIKRIVSRMYGDPPIAMVYKPWTDLYLVLIAGRCLQMTPEFVEDCAL